MGLARLARGLTVVAVVGALLGTADAALADPGDVIVRFESGTDAAERAEARDEAGTDFEQRLPVTGMQLVDPEAGMSVSEAVERLEESDRVLYAEPDYTRSATVRPNDPSFGSEWGLNNTGQTVAGVRGTNDADMDLLAAWDRTTGSASLTVAVVDTGVDFTHPDLSSNLRINAGETGSGRESNGRDDDGNGYVDDVLGWDFTDGDNNPQDPNGHGTHVAGTLGARGNDNRGVAGVAWRVGILPVRVLEANGLGHVSDIIAGYNYAVRAGARIINVSIAGPGFSQAELDAIRAAPNTMFVVGAGNDGMNNDADGTYPCNQPAPNVICVGATDQNDRLASFSNYGRQTVDLVAPGVNILSTRPGNKYGYMSGTSMATPHVAGTVALMWSRFPGASVAAVRASLLGSTDRLSELGSKTVSGGRANAGRALSATPTTAAFAPDSGVDPAYQPPAVPPLAPAPPGVDATPPKLSARFAKKVSLRTLLRKGMRVRTRCSEKCTVRLSITIARRRTATGLQVVDPNVVLGRGKGGIPRPGAKLIRVRMTKRSRRLLKRVRPHRLVVRAAAVDPAGNKASLKRAFRLRR